MSVGAKLLNAGMKLSGIKKKYALPEAQFAGGVSEEKRRAAERICPHDDRARISENGALSVSTRASGEIRRAAGSLHERGLRKAFDEKAGGGLLCAF
ncbi:MAG: hypothetical protein IKN72_00460 [Clostridia bacterium]|nr:hypothetical protein [Clostridia bacterium]